MQATAQTASCLAGKAAPVQGRRHAAANPLRAQRVARRAAAPASRTATVTKAVKVADHTDARQYIDTRHHAHIHNHREYEEMYQRSIEDPNGFWREIAMKEFHWETPVPEKHHNYNFDVRKGPIFTEWFKGGKTNIAYNCLDRHVKEGYGDQDCFLFEGNDVGRDGRMTYAEVLKEVCRLSNWLRSVGVKKGDSVAIYMPMVCELPIAMLACARIGAVHSVVFGGFSSDALASRIEDCKARVLITCNAVKRGAKAIDLKKIADAGCNIAKDQGFNVEHVLVYGNDDAQAKADTKMTAGRDVFWQDVIPQQKDEAEVEWMDAEDTLFYLYTSGSTGKPKGVLHTTGGFMVYSATTFKYVFAFQPGDVYWCTADCGWITGHSYMTYGPLLNRATQVVFEGVPTYPNPDRCWEVIDKYQVKQFYTAPTAIRSLMRSGDDWVKKHSRASLRVLGSVGEPINPEAWKWYHEVVGDGRCPIVDTWWQTETAGHMITPLPAAWPEKPGSASLPFFGVKPVLVDDKNNVLEGEAEGMLCIGQSWPSNIRTVYGDHERYETTYFAPFPGYYFSGDGARRDKDGYYWITGRVDDVINVSGHRIGTAEVESALVAHPQCAEAAVVGYEHPVKGQGIWAYVTLLEGVEYDDKLKKELVMSVREQIGAFAAPDVIHWAPGLPKTRSGKIMRRVLRKIASFEEDQLGDTSTLADPSVVETLLEMRGK
ncbi:hypothetical protein COHA_000389 [Chlorella ohadii]|uniref:Acetyl-coenzyme A synthetase n=1 Tax=Chlorella ohadii TaxID=2649997 RepID=A0AAD5E0B3_9CHLO|nr:hypothetical protein COHA_000389 [Chlorella ohadii]